MSGVDFIMLHVSRGMGWGVLALSLLALCAWAGQYALKCIFEIATLIEVAIEAKRQGRTPILRAWLRRPWLGRK